jgi:2-polyprenyl-6-methoxyphenol hydroxylase-like FAD-dependent oxidoreductase
MGWEVPALLDGMDTASDLYADRVSQIRMDAWSRDRVVLVGDAAACASLLAGEGTGLAMVEAYVLAGELARRPHDIPAAFAAYEQRLRTFIEGKQHSALRFRGFFAPRTRRALAMRNLVMRLMAIPWLSGRTGAFLGDDGFTLPDYEGA